jgi:hypothetical protein
VSDRRAILREAALRIYDTAARSEWTDDEGDPLDISWAVNKAGELYREVDKQVALLELEEKRR